MSTRDVEVSMLLLEAMANPNLDKTARLEKILDATSMLYEDAELENILAQGTIEQIRKATSLDEVASIIEKFDANLKTAQEFPAEMADIMKSTVTSLTGV